MSKQYYTYIYFDSSRQWNDGPEPFYVGKGSGNRSKFHLKRRGCHPLIQRLNKMIREDIQPIIQEIHVSNETAAFELEKGLIRLIGRKDEKIGPLLNLTDGGEGVPELTEEARKRLSKAAKERTYNDNTKMKMSESAKYRYLHNPHPRRNQTSIAWNKGKTGIYSEETLERMSLAKKGKPSPLKGKKTGKPAISSRPDVAAKISASKKGKKFTDEHRRALSIAAQNRRASQ